MDLKKVYLKVMSLCLITMFILNYVFVVNSYPAKYAGKQTRDISIDLTVDEIDFRSATFKWTYPSDLSFEMGDYLNLILVDEEIGDLGEAPIFSTYHNREGKSLSDITSFKINSLYPDRNYKALLQFVKFDGDVYTSEVSFSTSNFEISNMRIEGAEDNSIGNKNINITWETNPSDINLVEGDKVEIYLKTLSDGDFFKDPIFESTESVKNVNISLPNLQESYDFIISYLIGGHRLDSDLFFVDALAKEPTLQVTEIKSSSVKLTWDFPNVDILGESSALKIFLKEDYNLEYNQDPILSLTGKDQMIGTKEYIVKKLKFGTKYDVKMQMVIDTVTRFEQEKPVMVEKEYEFTTAGFEITDLKAVSGNTNVTQVTWNFNDENVSFSEGDKISAYIKESSQNTYSEDLLAKITITPEDMMTKKSLDITLPKYDTKYDIKLVYMIGGKYLYNYVSHTINLPKIDFGVQVLSNDSFKIKLSFDQNKIKFKETDRIEMFMREHKTEPEEGEYKQIQFTSEDFKVDTVPQVPGVPGAVPGVDAVSGSASVIEVDGQLGGEQPVLDREDPEASPAESEDPESEGVHSQQQSQETVVSGSEGISTTVDSQPGLIRAGRTDEDGTSEPQNIVKQLKVESVNTAMTSTEESIYSAGEKTYDIKVRVIKDNELFQEEVFKVAMKPAELQIIGVDYKRIDEKKVSATVKYAPFDYNFSTVGALKYEKTNAAKAVRAINKNKITILKDSIKERTQATGSIDNSNSSPTMENKFEIPFEDFGVYNLKFTYEIKTGPQEEEDEDEDEDELRVRDSANLKIGSRKISKKAVTQQTQSTTVEYQDTYNNSFNNVFDLEVKDVIFNQIKLGLGFQPYYTLKNGDKVDIFIKSEKATQTDGESSSASRNENDGFSSDPLVTFIHDGEKVDLLKINVIDLVGLDAGYKYTFKAKFTPKDYKGSIIEKTREVTTSNLAVESVRAKHFSDLAVDLFWSLESGFNFGPNDTLDVFYKKSDGNYDSDANESFSNIHLYDGATLYLDAIDSTYKIKFVFKSGETTLEKEVDFTNPIEDMVAEVYKVYETSSYIKWDYPKNYNLTDGETLSIFLKTGEEEYGEEPDYFMEHSEEDKDYLWNFKSVMLTDLMPDTEYDVKVLLSFGEVGKREKELHFKTNPVGIDDLSVTTLTPYDFSIKWVLNSKTIDFNPEYDSLNIYVKPKDRDEFTEDDVMYKVTDGISNYRKSRFSYDEDLSIYDIKIEYDFVQKKIEKVLEGTTLSLLINDDGNLSVIYPSSLKFSDGDKIELLKRGPDEEEYSSVSILDSGISSTNLFSLSEIPYGSSLLVLTTNSVTNVFPAEIFYGGYEEELPPIDIVSELTGTWVDLIIPEGYSVDTEGEVLNSIGGDSYFAETEDGEELIVIDRLVPMKPYEGAFVLTYDIDGNEIKFGLDDFTLEPISLLEEFLHNSYYFAFEREPDEGGYNYWKDILEEKKDITGKFFLINLMFAEREFADRNLGDADLIKVLYQIVVNRQYDEQGLNYWIGVYGEYLNEFNGDKYEAKKKIVLRMAYEPEFQKLCESMDIIW